jgi:hypothetical protein
MNTAAALTVPRGVAGKQRELYLSLSDDQKRIYREWFIVNGSLAAIAYGFAVDNYSMADWREGRSA